jgi:hypothetical protein
MDIGAALAASAISLIGPSLGRQSAGRPV